MSEGVKGEKGKGKREKGKGKRERKGKEKFRL